jgi:hypothetical protein
MTTKALPKRVRIGTQSSNNHPGALSARTIKAPCAVLHDDSERRDLRRSGPGSGYSNELKLLRTRRDSSSGSLTPSFCSTILLVCASTAG